jgi:glutathione-regulated potassium-efflux system ancillary protein KefC
VSLVGALGLAMSSTAIGLGTLAERSLMASRAGASGAGGAAAAGHRGHPDPRAGAAAGREPGGRPRSGWAAARALAVVLALVLGGHFLLRPALRWIARSELPELFTAAALLLVVGAAALMRCGRAVDGAGRLPGRRAAGLQRVPQARSRPTWSPSRACCSGCSSSPWA